MRAPIKIIIMLLLLAVLVFPIFLYRQIKISSISCNNQFGDCNSELNTELSLLLGKDIFLAREGIEKILDDKVYIKNYSIYYNIPDKLKVNTIIRKPRFSIYNGENYLMIDDEGTVLSLNESSALPSLGSSGRFMNVSEKVTNEELFSLQLLFDIQSLYKVKEASLDAKEFVIRLQDGHKVILPVSGDKEILVGSLILVIDSLKDSDFRSENDINVQIIDLRFKNPVLK